MFDTGELGVLAGKFARLDPTALSDEELTGVLGDAEATLRALQAGIAHVSLEVDRREVTDRTVGLGTVAWLGWTHQVAAPEARVSLRVGRFLASHRALDAALVEGRITLAHVRLLARLGTPRVAPVIAEIEQHLVDAAAGVRFETWATEIRALIELADVDGGHDPRAEDNRLSVTDGLDGSVHLQGDLVGDWALEVKAALEAEADRLFHRYRNDTEHTHGETGLPSRATLLAMALVELTRAGRSAGTTGTAPVADVTLVVTTPEGHRPPPEPDRNAGWLHGLIVTTLEGNPVAASTAAMLSCDPRARVLVESFEGDTLSLGRTRRLATPAQRHAAARTYGGCCFPCCDAPPNWTDLHHVTHWDTGGTTDTDNLAPLCRHHHGVIHRNGWTMAPTPGGFTITTPTGHQLHTQRHGRTPPSPQLRARPADP